MKRLKKVFTTTFILLLIVFLSFFVYANFSPPTAGERLYLENPTKIAVLNFPDKYTASDSLCLKKYLSKNTAIYSSVITMSSRTLCITFDPRKAERNQMLDYAASYDKAIKERIMPSYLKECPVNLLLFRKAKYALYVRK